MALIVEDGSGMSDAESYASVAEADAYHDAHGTPASWTAASTTTKEQALRKATDYLDEHYALDWKGARANTGQRLRWPRVGVFDSDGYNVPASGAESIPRRLKDATAILAVKSIDDGALLADVSSDGQITSETKTVGPISLSYDYAAGKGQHKVYAMADALLADYLGSSSMITERAG